MNRNVEDVWGKGYSVRIEANSRNRFPDIIVKKENRRYRCLECWEIIERNEPFILTKNTRAHLKCWDLKQPRTMWISQFWFPVYGWYPIRQTQRTEFNRKIECEIALKNICVEQVDSVRGFPDPAIVMEALKSEQGLLV